MWEIGVQWARELQLGSLAPVLAEVYALCSERRLATVIQTTCDALHASCAKPAPFNAYTIEK